MAFVCNERSPSAAAVRLVVLSSDRAVRCGTLQSRYSCHWRPRERLSRMRKDGAAAALLLSPSIAEQRRAESGECRGVECGAGLQRADG